LPSKPSTHTELKTRRDQALSSGEGQPTLDVAQRLGKPDGVRDIAGTGLELRRRPLIQRTFGGLSSAVPLAVGL
jgi:hypothetical protein